MKWPFSHPTSDSLVEFASRPVHGSEQQRVAQHLETCSSCRESVAVLRDLQRASHDVEPSDALLQRIIASRAAHVRTLLPTEDVVDAPARWRTALLAAVAGVVLMVGVFLWASNDASAGLRTGFLRFDPPRPLPGAVVQAFYTPGAPLQRYDSLVLRARFRRPNDDDYNVGPMQQRVVALRRTSGGVFNGEFRLPDSVIFAAFAVESPSGDVVDDNDQRLWELITVDSSGRLLFDALVQKQRDLMGRNWEDGLKVSRSLVSLYPEEPEAWSRLALYERWVLGNRIADSLLPAHRRRLAAFQQALSERQSLSAGTVSGMLSYAIQIDDSAARHFWLTRLQREFPDNPDVLFRRENGLKNQYIDYRHVDPRRARRYFEELEPLWAKAEPTGSPKLWLFAQNALASAMVTKDTVAFRVWIPRLRRVQRRTPGMAAYWAKQLLQYPSLRSEAMEWLRDDARLLARGPDTHRPLTSTVARQRAANRATAQPVLAELAGALIDQGDTTAGLDTLRLAATYGWNPAVFRRVGQIWASLGDTVQALQTFAKAAADPGSSRAFGDSIRAITAPNSSAEQWDAWVRQARDEMRTAVLEAATPRSLNGPMRLVTRNGEPRSLNDLVSGHVTVVAFWSPNCGFSVLDLGPLQRMADQLRRAGADVVAIVDQPFSAEVTRLLKEQHAEELPVFYDYRSDTRRAFVNFATPDYFVLDESGQIIFAHSKLENIPRQVAALVTDRSVSAH